MPPLDKISLLLVEDSEDDLFFFKRLCKKAGVNAPLAVATDGQQAVEHLTAALEGKQPIPQLIFLDLKLPLRSGFEVLEWLRAQPALARTTVVVLSSSAEGRDVERAYQLGAQGYLVKYPEAAVLLAVVQAVDALPATADLKTLKLPGLVRP
jgi:CheY-like chemotaxis protein